jgi:hypothetical protein
VLRSIDHFDDSGQDLVIRVVQLLKGFLGDVFVPQSDFKVDLCFGRFGF